MSPDHAGAWGSALGSALGSLGLGWSGAAPRLLPTQPSNTASAHTDPNGTKRRMRTPSESGRRRSALLDSQPAAAKRCVTRLLLLNSQPAAAKRCVTRLLQLSRRDGTPN